MWLSAAFDLFFFLHKPSPLGTVRCCLLELMWVVWAMQPCHPAPVSSSVPVWPAPPPPLPSHGVLSEGPFLWTQTTVPFVLPRLGMHSAIFSCVSASPTGCQTCGPHSIASSSLSFAFFHSVYRSLQQCQCLRQQLRVLRRGRLCDSGLMCTPLSKMWWVYWFH